MVDCLRAILGWVHPCLHYLEHEDRVGFYKSGVDDVALEVDETLRNERRNDMRGRNRRQAKRLEFVDQIAVAVANSDDLRRKLNGGYRNDALLGGAQRLEAIVTVADDARNSRRLKLDAHVPGHGHHIGAALVRRREHHDRAGLKHLVDPGKSEVLHDIGFSLRRQSTSPFCARREEPAFGVEKGKAGNCGSIWSTV